MFHWFLSCVMFPLCCFVLCFYCGCLVLCFFGVFLTCFFGVGFVVVVVVVVLRAFGVFLCFGFS